MDRRTKAWIGMTVKDFKLLLPKFEAAYNAQRENYRKDTRQRNIGGGRPPKIFDKPSKLLFATLFFIRVYPTFDLLEGIFCLDKSNLHHWITLGMSLVEDEVKEKLPITAEKTNNITDLLKLVPELRRHLTDATEQPINRPKYNQEFYYSGKKKRHTIKRQVIVTPNKKLIGISSAVEGKRHDKQLERDTRYLAHSPPGTRRLTDTAYADKTTDTLWGITTISPYKKPIGADLTEEQKIFNKNLSSIRVRVEHVIGHLKFNRIFSDKVRYRKMDPNQISNIVGGLYNFKLGY